MQFRSPAIVCSVRSHGETAVIVRLLTPDHGLVAAYVAGGRGRTLRPIVIPGNVVDADLRAKSDNQLPFARLELLASRGPWLAEPLPTSAIGWACALTATALPERHAYPGLFSALEALLDAICHAPSARGWVIAMVAFEALLLRELGYGGGAMPQAADWPDTLRQFDALSDPLQHYLLAERRGDVMAARISLRQRLERME